MLWKWMSWKSHLLQVRSESSSNHSSFKKLPDLYFILSVKQPKSCQHKQWRILTASQCCNPCFVITHSCLFPFDFLFLCVCSTLVVFAGKYRYMKQMLVKNVCDSHLQSRFFYKAHVLKKGFITQQDLPTSKNYSQRRYTNEVLKKKKLPM